MFPIGQEARRSGWRCRRIGTVGRFRLGSSFGFVPEHCPLSPRVWIARATRGCRTVRCCQADSANRAERFRISGWNTRATADDVPVRVEIVEPASPEFATFRLSADVESARPDLPRFEIELAVRPEHPLTVREVRQRLHLIAPSAIERFRGVSPDAGSEDRTLMGVPMNLVRPRAAVGDNRTT